MRQIYDGKRIEFVQRSVGAGLSRWSRSATSLTICWTLLKVEFDQYQDGRKAEDRCTAAAGLA